MAVEVAVVWSLLPSEDILRMAVTASPMLNMEQAAEYLGVKHRTLQAYYRQWNVPHYKIGRIISFRENELETWLLEKRVA